MKKHLGIELKDLDDKGQVAFYFSKFDVKDSDGDIVVKGAFQKTSQSLKRIKFFYNHNLYQVPGRLKEINEDDTGGWAVADLALKTNLGKDVYEQYKAGIITEHSYGYDVINSTQDKEKEAQIIKEVKLYELSALTAWGANEFTDPIYVKSEKYLKELLSIKEYDENLIKEIKNVVTYLESLKAGAESDEPINWVKYLNDNLFMEKK